MRITKPYVYHLSYITCHIWTYGPISITGFCIWDHNEFSSCWMNGWLHNSKFDQIAMVFESICRVKWVWYYPVWCLSEDQDFDFDSEDEDVEAHWNSNTKGWDLGSLNSDIIETFKSVDLVVATRTSENKFSLSKVIMMNPLDLNLYDLISGPCFIDETVPFHKKSEKAKKSYQLIPQGLADTDGWASSELVPQVLFDVTHLNQVWPLQISYPSQLTWADSNWFRVLENVILLTVSKFSVTWGFDWVWN